jgi:hypothetical protein
MIPFKKFSMVSAHLNKSEAIFFQLLHQQLYNFADTCLIPKSLAEITQYDP